MRYVAGQQSGMLTGFTGREPDIDTSCSGVPEARLSSITGVFRSSRGGLVDCIEACGGWIDVVLPTPFHHALENGTQTLKTYSRQ